MLVAWLFKGFFLASILKSPLQGFCAQHGLNMGPTWVPKRLQNRRKIDKKTHHILDTVFNWFFVDFGRILGGFWKPRWGQVGTKMLSKRPSKTTLPKNAKSAKSAIRMPLLGVRSFQDRWKIHLKSTKNRWKNHSKLECNFWCILEAFGRRMWPPKPSQNRSQIDKKSMKNGHQNRLKF